MIMITGGAFQGKREAAVRITGIESDRIADGAQCSMEELMQASGVHGLHLFIRGMLDRGEDPSVLTEKIPSLNPDLVIITDEVGYGIVPMDKTDRLWREACGRVCTALASQCEHVYRVVAGVPMKLK